MIELSRSCFCGCRLVALLLAASLGLMLSLGRADDKKAEPRTVIGKNGSAAAMVLARPAPGKPWQPLKQGEDVYSGDTLVGLPGAFIDTKDGGVRLELLADLAGNSPLPVLDAAVVLHPAKDVDLDFTLSRGRVEVENRKAKGSAKVRIRFHKEVWEVTLNEPKTEIGMELFGRWARGVYFEKDAKKPQEPTAELVFIVITGSIELKYGNKQVAMNAPPGPALFHWDSVSGADGSAQRLDKLPDWADPKAKPSLIAKEKEARIAKFREMLTKEPADKVIPALLKSKDANERKLAVVALGALDDVGGIADAFNHTEYPDVRDQVITVIRHWLGRGPGQDQKFYDFLLTERKYTPAHAEIALRLLHSFSEADLGRPETYEALIFYLMHERIGIREMARWQLYRLVPAGKDIAYDAAAPEKEREAAVEKWRKLIPEGKLPERPKVEPKDK